MGQVFLAEDLTLHRSVALKFLPESEGANPESRQRLRREARALAALSHRNIVTVYALEAAGHRDFLVMEYLQGETLAERIAQRPLPVPEVINAGIAVAEGLAHAHSRGVVHRDVKPGNIIVTLDRQVRLADFGIARVAEASTITGHGFIAGTVVYMSPEQARGERADARSDLFSLGVVMYEALTGTHPFPGERPESILYAIQHVAPEPPTAMRSGIPRELERIVLKCMQKDPGLRYQHAEDLAADLRGLEHGVGTPRPAAAPRSGWAVAAGSVAIIGGLVAVLWYVGRAAGLWPGAAIDTHTVLVLPLEVHGQAEGAEDAGRAFAEAVAVNLAQASQTSVLPVPLRQELRTGTTMGLKKLAERLGAGRLVIGSLARDGRQLRARISLVDVTRNRLLWGGERDSPEGNMAMLAVSLATDLKERLGARPNAAYEYFRYVSGSPAMAGWPELPATIGALRRHEVEEGLRLTARLVEAYPNEPAARLMRLVAFTDANNQGIRGASDSNRAGIAALERVDPNNPHVTIDRAGGLRGKRAPEAVELLTKVLTRDDLTPALRSFALRTRGRAYSDMRRDSAAIEDLRLAIDHDPANPWNYAYFATACEVMSRFEDAAVALRMAVAIDPDDVAQQIGFAWALRNAGHTAESASVAARICENAKSVGGCVLQARLLLEGGHRDEALALARTAEHFEGITLYDQYELARFWAIVGDPTRSLRLLRQGLAQGMNAKWLPDLKAEKDFARLWGDPEFESILSELSRRKS